ncbi:hypothetical protein GCM10010508_33690 [Streptomyces naganishii JCM 4654]|uniref:Uncharacterized protein n=1 Tax=Streptomyces naganishii JCM 4654 TaxID=1306179 RepID=A0A918Y3Z9_9ACTN|nr:hypothetical protein GCM10010508_33690 [Streptomyces naganishii JCM 4654]
MNTREVEQTVAWMCVPGHSGAEAHGAVIPLRAGRFGGEWPDVMPCDLGHGAAPHVTCGTRLWVCDLRHAPLEHAALEHAPLEHAALEHAALGQVWQVT